VEPDLQGRGIGTVAMKAITPILDEFEIGALGTGEFGFYERLGWERWQGPTATRTDSGIVRTPEDDGGIMIRRTPLTGPLDLTETIVCDARDGDVW
jgi:aminoglycoside 2'-N-acetyltransferase I